VLEIVLGIDNVIFISILAGKLRNEDRERARKVGLSLAMLIRLLLLASITWVMGLTQPLFSVADHPVSLRDLVLLGGGLFLLAKGTTEIHATVEGVEQEIRAGKAASFASVVVQIMILDIVFSLDSVITAVGMASHVSVMAAAIIIAVLIMMFAANPLSAFIEEHLSVKMLALAFLILVGVALIADGMGFHIPKGYLYFAIAFSVAVESLNVIAKKRRIAARAAEQAAAEQAAAE